MAGLWRFENQKRSGDVHEENGVSELLALMANKKSLEGQPEGLHLPTATMRSAVWARRETWRETTRSPCARQATSGRGSIGRSSPFCLR